MEGEGNSAAARRREQLGKLLRERASAPAEHPLSYNQRSLWFMNRLAPESAAYNVPYAFRLLSPADPASVAALRQAFEMLMARHAILRTTYSPSEPVQIVHPAQPLDFVEIDAVGLPEADLLARLAADAQRPFDLQHGPVLRVRLYRTSREPILLATFHHIAYDLWSMLTFLTELGALYRAAREGAAVPLPALEAQYTDFVAWQAEKLAADGERLWEYWRERLSGALPVLRLAADRPRPPVQSYAGATFLYPISGALAERLQQLARAEGVTIFAVLVTAFQIFLHARSGQPDILVGTPMAGRSRAEFEGLLGFFLNTLPLRARLSGDPAFRDLLRATRDEARGALEHQDYPLELLVERLRPPRSPQHAPLFQAMFVWNQPHRMPAGAERDERDLTLERIPIDVNSTQFDVSLEVDQLPDGLGARWEYSTDILSQDTISRWAAQFDALLAAIVDAPDRRVGELIEQSRQPRSPLEEIVAGIFRDVLGVDRPRVDDSFLDRGGDSDTATRIAGRLSALAGVPVPVARVFEAPTVAELAALLEELVISDL